MARGRPPRRDPRQLGGDIAGPGGPFDEDSVVVDVRGAVLLDGCTVSLVATGRAGHIAAKPDLAMLLEGRVNQSSDRAKILYLFNEDGAAAIVSELVGLAIRIGPEFAQRLTERLARDAIAARLDAALPDSEQPE